NSRAVTSFGPNYHTLRPASCSDSNYARNCARSTRQRSRKLNGRWYIFTELMNEKSLQETYAPHMACFGCGPANEQGLHIRSFPDGDEVIARVLPQTHHR